jgi:hypothetical protein
LQRHFGQQLRAARCVHREAAPQPQRQQHQRRHQAPGDQHGADAQRAELPQHRVLEGLGLHAASVAGAAARPPQPPLARQPQAQAEQQQRGRALAHHAPAGRQQKRQAQQVDRQQPALARRAGAFDPLAAEPAQRAEMPGAKNQAGGQEEQGLGLHR